MIFIFGFVDDGKELLIDIDSKKKEDDCIALSADDWKVKVISVSVLLPSNIFFS